MKTTRRQNLLAAALLPHLDDGALRAADEGALFQLNPGDLEHVATSAKAYVTTFDVATAA